MRGVTLCMSMKVDFFDYFYSHASCEAWHRQKPKRLHMWQISTHTPHARRDILFFMKSSDNLISTHTPHARRDILPRSFPGGTAHFYSHASCEAWRLLIPLQYLACNFYSHASCEAWQNSTEFLFTVDNFYSHASCEAWPHILLIMMLHLLISTHTPHARRDVADLKTLQHYDKFLLTRLMRGVTQTCCQERKATRNFYSHASCEAWLHSLTTVFPL